MMFSPAVHLSSICLSKTGHFQGFSGNFGAKSKGETKLLCAIKTNREVLINCSFKEKIMVGPSREAGSLRVSKITITVSQNPLVKNS